MFTCKSCRKTTNDSLLDEGLDKVICSECGKPIEGITDFMKRTMRSNGQVVKGRTKKAFVVQCHRCQRHGQPIIKEDSPVCFHCGNKLNLTNEFVSMLQEFLKQ